MTVDTKTRPIAAYAEQRAAGDSEFTRRFVATTSGVKRDGLDIDLEGMSVENFMRNPVFLYVHDYFGERLPLGLVKKISMQKKRMIVTVLFDDGDEFAMEVLRKYDAGFLNAVSIGWETLEFDRETMRVLQSDLLDVSAVPVPGDPDALMMRQASLLRSLGTELLDKFPEESDTGGSGGLAIDDLTDEEANAFLFALGKRDGMPEWLQKLLAENAAIERVFEGGAKCAECGDPVTDDDYRLVDLVVHCVDCADKISGEQQETIDTQEGKRMAKEREERVIAALDEFRSALSDWIDSATDEDTESMRALLAAFPGDETNEGDED